MSKRSICNLKIAFALLTSTTCILYLYYLYRKNVPYATIRDVVIQAESNWLKQMQPLRIMRKPVILMWTTFFGQQLSLGADCPIYKQCVMTYNRSVLADADAIVFHGANITASEELELRRSTNGQIFVFSNQETEYAFNLWEIPSRELYLNYRKRICE